MQRNTNPLRGSKWSAIDDESFVKSFQSGLRVSAPDPIPRSTPVASEPIKAVQATAPSPVKPSQGTPPQPLIDTTNQDSGKRKASGQPQQDLKSFLSDSMDIDRSSREHSQSVRSRETSASMQWQATTPTLKPSSEPFVPMPGERLEHSRIDKNPTSKWSEYANQSSLPSEQTSVFSTEHEMTPDAGKAKTHNHHSGLLGSKHVPGSERRLDRWEASQERAEAIRRRIDEMTALKQGVASPNTESKGPIFYQSQPASGDTPIVYKPNVVTQAKAFVPNTTPSWIEEASNESWISRVEPAPSMASFNSSVAPSPSQGRGEQPVNASKNDQRAVTPSKSHYGPTSSSVSSRFKTVIPPPSSPANSSQPIHDVATPPITRKEPAGPTSTPRTKTVIPPVHSTTAAASLQSVLDARSTRLPTVASAQHQPAPTQIAAESTTQAVSYPSLSMGKMSPSKPDFQQPDVISPTQSISPPALSTVAPTPAPSPVVHTTTRKSGRQKIVMSFPVRKPEPIQIPPTQPHVATQEGSPKKQRLSYEQSLIQDAKMPSFPPLEPSVADGVASKGRGFQAEKVSVTPNTALPNAPVTAPPGDVSAITSWPAREARTYGPAEIRRVKLLNLPSSSTPSTLASLTYGGALEQIQYIRGSSSGTVLFLDPADCKAYFDNTANGIEFPAEVEEKLNRAAGVVGGAALVAQTRLLRTIWVEKHNQPEPVSGVVKRFIDKEFTRCVKAIGIEDSWTPEYLRQRAEGKGSAARKVEHVGVRVSERGVRIAEFRFCDINHAVRFKAEMTRDDDWEACNLQFFPDPCAVARDLHFE